MFTLPVIGHFLGLSSKAFGLWAGLAIHQTPQVVAAGFAYSPSGLPYSPEAGQTATIVKLARVCLLAPVVFVIGLVYARRKLTGKGAEDRQRIRLRDVPPDYAPIQSGLGATTPRSVVILPILFEDETRAVLELASIEELSEIHLAFLDQLSESIGIVLATIIANMRAEELVQEQAARVEAEAGLARLRQVVDVMPEGILIADAAGVFLAVYVVKWFWSGHP